METKEEVGVLNHFGDIYELQFEDKYGFFLFIFPIQRVYGWAYLRIKPFCGTL